MHSHLHDDVCACPRGLSIICLASSQYGGRLIVFITYLEIIFDDDQSAYHLLVSIRSFDGNNIILVLIRMLIIFI